MSRLRTFIAVDVDEEIRRGAAKLTQSLSTVADKVRWVSPDAMHLTLKFLGEVEDRELNDVCQIAAAAAREHDPFNVAVQGAGAFPNPQKPTVVWMGVEDDSGELVAMQKQIESALCAQLRIPVENRPYRPHITLGRNTSQGGRNPELSEMIEAIDEEFGILRVDALVVYSSELTRKGPEYTVLGRCPLGKK